MDFRFRELQREYQATQSEDSARTLLIYALRIHLASQIDIERLAWLDFAPAIDILGYKPEVKDLPWAECPDFDLRALGRFPATLELFRWWEGLITLGGKPMGVFALLVIAQEIFYLWNQAFPEDELIGNCLTIANKWLRTHSEDDRAAAEEAAIVAAEIGPLERPGSKRGVWTYQTIKRHFPGAHEASDVAVSAARAASAQQEDEYDDSAEHKTAYALIVSLSQCEVAGILSFDEAQKLVTESLINGMMARLTQN